ncbi:hypothetical protein G7084_00035 [Weissella coleopterorum]|uniref:Uncharacterized protein n=1 Tax=Weissella coleopterorum TaxID=2714949 RepID=A0A6G8AY09_9LACO|nr:hypothetical protein [Weissella coleopterorum]QIL49849.1 hypothetical protein G7084_00035 [Weissella coleopterorum]
MNDIINNLMKADVNVIQLYSALKQAALIDEVPPAIKKPVISEYDEKAHLNLGNAFLLLKNKINDLLKVLYKYDLVDMYGNGVVGIEYWLINALDFKTLKSTYNNQLSVCNKTITKIQEIVILNGLMERK